MAQILVVTNSYDDLHVQAVERELRKRGSALFRVDVDLLVRGQNRVVFDFQDGLSVVTLRTDAGDIRDAEVDSVWVRKPFGFGDSGFVESIRDPVQRATVAKEIGAVVDSLFALLEDRFWLNKPAAVARARLKPLQLRLAREAGLRVPRTIITNDSAVARSFCRLGPTVFKPLVETALKYDDRTLFVETTLLTDAHIDQFHLIAHQPVLLQAYIDKRFELRVTYVAGKMFVARQELTPDCPPGIIDWRALQGTPASSYAQGQLTHDTSSRIANLMERLGLQFGALDLAVDQDGNEYFLEVNPAGQWLGYTDEIGLPAAAEIARCLVTGRTSTG